MEEIMSNAKAIELTGEETQVHFSSAFPYFWVRNDGSGTVLMSLFPNVSEGKDGVIEVPAGSSAGTMHGYNATCNDFYISGSGKVQVMGTYTPENPFKSARKGGDSGGGTDGTILLNMPLTNDLSDISGFDRSAEYTGNTPLTITAEDGIYLYGDTINIDINFLDSLNYVFTVEFDVKLNTNGLSGNIYNRQIISIYNDYYNVGLQTTDSSNGLKIGTVWTLSKQPTINKTPTARYKYNNQEWHHITLVYDKTAYTMAATIDGKDPLMVYYPDTYLNPQKIQLGHTSQGLNGYIKNLVIKTA